MALFKPPKRVETDIKDIIKKANSVVEDRHKGIRISGNSLLDKIAGISKVVEQSLGNLKGNYLLITDEEEWLEYCRQTVKDGTVALDTETAGIQLNEMKQLAGVCIQSLNQKAAYIPVGHISNITEDLLPNQVSMRAIAKGLQLLKDSNTKIIFHNGYFDLLVLKLSTDIWLDVYWDTLPAACLLNENESHSLKYLYNKYIMNGKAEVHKFGELFDGIPFCYIPPKVGYVYGAFDAVQTLELYKFQKLYLTRGYTECHECGLERIADILRNIEFPLIRPLAEMKFRGVEIDFNTSNNLLIEYTAMKDTAVVEYNKAVEVFRSSIIQHNLCKTPIEIPPNPDSPQQVSILLYDILNVGVIDKKKPRGTSADILSEISKLARFKSSPVKVLVDCILKVKEYNKLLGTFIEKIPKMALETNGFIHCNFNANGAATSRMSSTMPNLQQISSHHADIRNMFIPGSGRVFISCDYSRQEILCIAELAKDEKLLDSFRNNQDIYSFVASIAFNLPYSECTEFNPDGTTNHEGKERRKSCKQIVLGILYGKGVHAIGIDLDITVEKAQEIKDSILKAFPDLAKYLEDVIVFLRKNGYVEDLYGRKRRLPDIMLPEYEFEFSYGVPNESKNHYTNVYTTQLKNTRTLKDKNNVISDAAKLGITIKQNGGFIAQAIRQAYNSPVQSTAAEVTKMAIINIHNNKQLQEMGVELVLSVHDENICSCPIEYAYEASKIIEQCSIDAGVGFSVNLMCDIAIEESWCGKEYTFDENNKLIEKAG